jgi:hypothetical protein
MMRILGETLKNAPAPGKPWTERIALGIKCQKDGRKIVAWTVNDPKLMRWCIRKKLTGVITDDPELYLKIREEQNHKSAWELLTLRMLFDFIAINALVTLGTGLFIWRFGIRVDKSLVLKSAQHRM